jgi:hypothetical protein
MSFVFTRIVAKSRSDRLRISACDGRLLHPWRLDPRESCESFPKESGTTLITPRPVKNRLEASSARWAHSYSTDWRHHRRRSRTARHSRSPSKVAFRRPPTSKVVCRQQRHDPNRRGARPPAGGGAQSTITIQLMGCNVGQARPLIEKFKSAMTPAGGRSTLIAPLPSTRFAA